MRKTLLINEYNTIIFAHNEIDNAQFVIIGTRHILLGTHNAMENAQYILIGNIK